MSYQVCIDIGGTFTDCLVVAPDGEVRIFKSPTTPDDFGEGFVNVLHVAAKGYGLEPGEFIGQIVQIVHGSTVSTNALIERKVPPTGIILNEGHKDILTLREGPRKGAFEWKIDYPAPYIPAALTQTVRGRIDARGNEHVALDEDQVRSAVQTLMDRQVKAIAVGLLWSVVNPAHELRVAEIIREMAPQMAVSLSHKVNPLPREYKRIIATAIDASISPVVASYISKLVTKLDEARFEGELLLANCVGGMMPTEAMIQKPIYSVMSGPTLAPMAALALTLEKDVIVGDMGGTTFDVSALRDHKLIVTPDSMIHDDALGIPKVDVRSVGAGGGSIAYVDVGGMLKVGPQSAGARPGPACFDKGGDQPTVTDANLLLGLIDPDYFLGGAFPLRRDLAQQAVAPLARQMGVSIEAAAYAIYTTANHNMVGAIEDITIREGLNPRDSYFVAGGGGTALHIAEMADIMGLSSYMIPRFMAGLSAFGGLISDLRNDFSGALHTDARRFRLDDVNALIADLTAQAQGFLETARVPEDMRAYELSFQGRYEYQSWEIEVPFTMPDGGLTQADIEVLSQRFHEIHERIYSIRNEDDLVEFTRWNVRAIGRRDTINTWRKGTLNAQDGALVPKAHRPVWIQDGLTGGMRDLPVYELTDLAAGAEIQGPSVVEAETFTAIFRPGHDAKVDQLGNLIVTIQRS